MTVNDTPAPAKDKAPLSDTQEVPVTAAAPVPPYDIDDLDDEDEEAARRLDAKTRRRARQITTALALVAALGLGFYGGILYQKHEGGTSSNSSAASAFSAFGAAFGGGGRTATGASGSGSGRGTFPGLAALGGSSSTRVSGTVTAEGNGVLYVTPLGSSSALVKVVTNPQSSVTTSQTAPLSSVQPGDTVTVSGAKQKDGSFMASSIRDSGSASTTGGGGGGFFGG